MNFEFSEEQNMLREQAQGFLASNCSMAVVRRVLDGDEPYAADLWKKVAEMGWTATVIPEEYEGLGLTYLELSVIAEELGRALAPIPFSSSVYLATEAILAAGSEEQKQAYLPGLAAGNLYRLFRPWRIRWADQRVVTNNQSGRLINYRGKNSSGRWRYRKLRDCGGNIEQRRWREPLYS